MMCCEPITADSNVTSSMAVNIDMLSMSADVATSLELRFLIDRHLAARRSDQNQVASVCAHAAEGLITTALPVHADAIGSVASRKGDGHLIGCALAQHLSPASAAAVSVIWMLRGARRPAIDALAEAFQNDPIFNDTIRLLCSRIIPRTEASPPPMTITPIEVASPRQR